MTSGGGPEGYCKSCGEYSQSRTIAHSGLCMACNRIFEKKGCINCIYIDEDNKTGICSGCFRTSDKKNFTYKGGKMSHHGEHVFGTYNTQHTQTEDQALLSTLHRNHSDATKRMFSEFVLMHNEIKSMGIEPEQLSRVWNPARTG